MACEADLSAVQRHDSEQVTSNLVGIGVANGWLFYGEWVLRISIKRFPS